MPSIPGIINPDGKVQTADKLLCRIIFNTDKLRKVRWQYKHRRIPLLLFKAKEYAYAEKLKELQARYDIRVKIEKLYGKECTLQSLDSIID